MSGRGKVYLVGAGPGDPELMTLKGLRLLKEADTVIHDRLVSAEILRHAREDATLIEVGKTPGGPSFDQEEICRLLVERASAGEKVLRLKNGDPFIFGRGGEEVLYLAEKGVDFEIVPGLSSAIAVPTSAGVPLTHRGLSRSVAILTGHTMEGEGFPDHKWEWVARGCDTLVVLMGHGNLARIVKKLQEAGIEPLKPAAAISWGTTPGEKVVFSSLADLPRRSEEEGVGPPLTLIIGETVRIGERIRPFLTEKALSGKKILLLSDERSGESLARDLSSAGGVVLHIPAIRVEENHDEKVSEFFGRNARYDWVIFTSKNAVDHLFRHLERAGSDARVFAGSSICAIGPGTARSLERHHLRADALPRTYSTRGVLSMLCKLGVEGKRVLLVRSNLSDPSLREALKRAGAEVEEIHPYRVRVVDREHVGLIDMLTRKEVDIVLLTSPSTVMGLLNMTGKRKELLKGLIMGCIGPVTARSALSAGIPVSFQAREYCDQGLVRALIDHLGR